LAVLSWLVWRSCGVSTFRSTCKFHWHPIEKGLAVADVVDLLAGHAIDDGRTAPGHEAQVRIGNATAVPCCILNIDLQRLWTIPLDREILIRAISTMLPDQPVAQRFQIRRHPV